MNIHREDITAVILAGGQGRRMGGQDKGLIEFDGKPLAALLVDRLRQQAVDIVINANRNHRQYQQFALCFRYIWCSRRLLRIQRGCNRHKKIEAEDGQSFYPR